MARPQAADYEDRKELIVDEAAKLVAAQSFLGTSISDIAKACDFSKSLLYHYYDSKEKLLFAVMTSHIDRLDDIVKQTLEVQAPAPEKMRLLLQRFMGEYAEAASKQRVLVNELGHLPDSEKGLIVRKQRRIVEHVQSILVESQPGLKPDPARARALTMLLFGMINWTSNWYNPKGPVSPDDIANMAADLILRA